MMHGPTDGHLAAVAGSGALADDALQQECVDAVRMVRAGTRSCSAWRAVNRVGICTVEAAGS